MDPLKLSPVMVQGPRVSVSRFDHLKRPQGRREELPWVELAQRLEDDREPWPGEKADLPLWSGAVFDGDHRKKDNHEATHVFVLDYDDEPGASLDAFEVWWSPRCSWVAHTSSSHLQEGKGPRWRVALLLSRPLTAEEHRQVGGWFRGNPELFGKLGGEAVDPARAFFIPSAPEGAPFETGAGGAGALDVDALLAHLEDLQTAPLDVPEPYTPPTVEQDADVLQRRLRGLLAAWCEDLANTHEQRHKRCLQLARMAGGYWATYGGQGFTRSEALDALQAAVESTGYRDPGRRQTLEYGWDEGAKLPATLEERDNPYAFDREQLWSWGGKTYRLPSEGPAMQQNADGTEEPAPDIDPSQVEQEGKPVASGYGWLDAAWKAAPLADILLKDPPPQRWLLDDVLPLGEVAMLAAEGGAGKTMALLQLALAVALPAEAGPERTHWLGYPVGADAQSGRVLVVLGEETTETVWRRFRRVVEGLSLAPWLPDVIQEERIRFIAGASVGGSLALVDRDNEATDLVTGLRRRMEGDGSPYSLVILDPAAQFSDGQFEVDNGAATAFVRALQDLARTPGGPTILLAHHTSQGSRTAKKATATAARGVTGLNDAVRWHAHMQPRDPFRLDDGTEVRTVEFEVVKANNAAIPAGQLLERMEYGVLVPVKPARRADYAKRAAVAAKLAEWANTEKDNEVFEAARGVRSPPGDAEKAFRDRVRANTRKAKQGAEALTKAKGKVVHSVQPDDDIAWKVP